MVLPHVETGFSEVGADTIVAFIFTFYLVFMRSLLLNVKEIQGDRMLGRETIPILFGPDVTKAIMMVFSLVMAAVLIITAATGITALVGYYFVALVLFTCSYILVYHWRIVYEGIALESLVDSKFMIAGFIALAWNLFHA